MTHIYYCVKSPVYVHGALLYVVAIMLCGLAQLLDLWYRDNKEHKFYFDDYTPPNMTLKVIEDADNGIDLSEPFDNVDDLMVALDA